jgi:undecaprenyl-diphosphatase
VIEQGVIAWWQALLLALVQGLTEFLPISSSAHLVIPGLLFGWPDQGLAFDVAVHVGTLLAVLLYFRADLQQLLLGSLQALRARRANCHSREVLLLALATLPVVLAGLWLNDIVQSHLRTLPVIASTTLVFGLLLAVADRRRAARPLPLGWGIALGIGLAQMLAPVPGVSRSGITITAGLLLGLDRSGAARFSFLLSIPVIAGAGLLKGVELAQSSLPVAWLQLLAAALVAGLTAYLCIALFLRLLERIGLMPFVYYRVLLALLLFALAAESVHV